jgi:hypothetical protein
MMVGKTVYQRHLQWLKGRIGKHLYWWMVSHYSGLLTLRNLLLFGYGIVVAHSAGLASECPNGRSRLHFVSRTPHGARAARTSPASRIGGGGVPACASSSEEPTMCPGRSVVSGAQPTPGEGGDTKAMQQKTRRKMQHPIYFWNIQTQHLQHTSEDRWNTWNMCLKHLKKYLKNTWNHCKHTQHPDKTLATSVWNTYNI